MGADERLFAPQLAAFPNLRVPAWIEPLHDESLRHYAKRLASVVDPGCPCIVGGASFGGAVALEMAPCLQTIACVLIGSVRSSDELLWHWRALRPLARLGPDWLGVAAQVAGILGRPVLKRGDLRRLERLARPEAGFFRWARCAVVRWRPSPATRRVRVFQIHGEADRTLPVGRTRPDTIVPGGSHALTIFNSEAVNAFLRSILEWARLTKG
jgi:pimeloyl-ACP methyl ester carboxylesterase